LLAAAAAAVCAAGNGGPGCAICPYNTFTQGTTADGDACDNCPNGTISARAAYDSNLCFKVLQEPVNDFFALSDETSWVRVPGTSQDACFTSCVADANCIQVRWSSFCEIHYENTGGSREIGFRTGLLSLDYAFYRIKDNLEVGKQLSTRTVASKQACLNACKSEPSCEAVVFDSTSGSCALVASDLVEGYAGVYHLVGSRLYTDSFITEP
jgi:hypothetical protein